MTVTTAACPTLAEVTESHTRLLEAAVTLATTELAQHLASLAWDAIPAPGSAKTKAATALDLANANAVSAYLAHRELAEEHEALVHAYHTA